MWGILLVIAIVTCDQLSKYAIRSLFSVNESVSVIGDFFELRYIQNDGAAFSSFAGKQAFLIAVSIIAIIGAAFFLRKMKSEGAMFKIALLCIIAGGIGNLIDRFILGYVTDMLSFSIFPPVFNIADIAVCLGCGILIIYVLFFMKDDKPKKEVE
ncbi:MAG: signal peptidase II [[Eubacterium] sulci]|jgi:signal peptidase II|nr:signal peptidase II [[Eubacterium] sulci]MBF1189253.1 signal peptidase II [[Eubacterium] sulci]